MKRINWLLTLSSLNLILISVERFSPTTQVLLQPSSFLRLHEVVQMVFLILFSVLIPCFVLYTITSELRTLEGAWAKSLVITFVIGLYLYTTGNGVHEVASFLFNQYCPPTDFTAESCRSMFFDDYYFGNAVYFVGAFLFTAALILLEQDRPTEVATRSAYVVLTINALVYSLAIIAYVGFDRVVVGLVYSVFTTIFIVGVILWARRKLLTTPFTLYSVIAYLVGTLTGLVIRAVR